MSNVANSRVTAMFTLLVVLFTAFQGVIPAIPLSNQTAITVLSSVTMFLVSALTLWKQWLSNEINNKSLKPTLIVTIVATLGLLNDLFGVVHISGLAGQWVRFGLTFITMFLNLISKVMYPTEETKSRI